MQLIKTATTTEEIRSGMPARGWRVRNNLRVPVHVAPPAHGVSSRTLAATYPFIAESGAALTGPYIGENMLARSPFCLDPWDAYGAGAIRSHSAAIIGVKGSGKSMLSKSWATRLVRCGRNVIVPHDPNGEWVRVAEYVGGKSIAIGPGLQARINLLDVGPRIQSLSLEDWRQYTLQTRRSTLRAVLSRLQGNQAVIGLADEENTALDLALEHVASSAEVTVPDVYRLFGEMAEDGTDTAAAARKLWHRLRRIVAGDLQGLFDGPTTVPFDATAPMMVIDTSRMKATSKLTQELARLATKNWIRQATTGSNRTQRVVVHEEAAVELLNMVAAGEGLTEQVQDEKVARHDGVAHWYLLHRINDLNALGDDGSAIRSQALGLLADCDTRVTYSQHEAEIPDTAKHLGWNDTQADQVTKLRKGQGLWQVGADRVALVKNICTPGEEAVFRTDTLGGTRA